MDFFQVRNYISPARKRDRPLLHVLKRILNGKPLPLVSSPALELNSYDMKGIKKCSDLHLSQAVFLQLPLVVFKCAGLHRKDWFEAIRVVRISAPTRQHRTGLRRTGVRSEVWKSGHIAFPDYK